MYSHCCCTKLNKKQKKQHPIIQSQQTCTRRDQGLIRKQITIVSQTFGRRIFITTSQYSRLYENNNYWHVRTYYKYHKILGLLKSTNENTMNTGHLSKRCRYIRLSKTQLKKCCLNEITTILSGFGAHACPDNASCSCTSCIGTTGTNIMISY